MALLFGLLGLTVSACRPAGAPLPDARTASWEVAPPTAGAPPGTAPASAAPGPESALATEGFRLIEEEHGVKVFRRDERPGVELAAVGDLDAPPAQVRRALLDYPTHQRWQEHLAQNRILDRGDDHLLVYQRLALPLIDDRDFTLLVTWGEEGDVLWMRFASAPERGPAEVPDVVRVRDHAGGWRLEPLDGGRRTHAVYRFHLDLAGSVPMWLGKGRAAEDVIRFFQSLGAQLPAYR